MLRLSRLDSDGMGDDTRDAFVNMAENLGLDPGDAEDLVDLYLEEADQEASTPGAPAAPAPMATTAAAAAPNAQPAPMAAGVATVEVSSADRERFPGYVNSVGGQMFFVPSGEFVMGSECARGRPQREAATQK